MTKKIAIVGSAKGTMSLAPYDNSEWEIWGLAWRFNEVPRMDVGFEIHDDWMWSRYTNENYNAWLKSDHIPIYVRPEVAKKYKTCTAYPVDKAIDLMGRNYFVSSFAYMLALAILEGATEIGIYGVDLVSDEEYAHQRPNAEYLLGIAHAKGIKLTIPDQSALLKHDHIYGAQDAPKAHPLIDYYKEKMQDYDQQIEEIQAKLHSIIGAKHECSEVITALTCTDRGALGGNPNGD